jgi:CRISPR/Cas system-associated exonuclease Cas4 (RecB family)
MTESKSQPFDSEAQEYTIQPKARNKIHASHIKQFLMCPAIFFFRYVKGIRTPHRSALVLGKSLHRAAERNLVQKKDTRQDLPEPEILGVFEESWDLAVSEGISWEDDEKPGDEKDLGVACTQTLARVIMPPIQPQEVELRVEAPVLHRPYDLAGRIDTLDEKHVLRDFKTTGGYLSKNKTTGFYSPTAGDIIQITQYAMLTRSARLRVDNIELTYIHKKIKKGESLPPAWPAPFAPTPDHEQAFLRIADKICDAVERESYVPNPTCFVCTPQKCSFWEHCRGGAIF